MTAELRNLSSPPFLRRMLMCKKSSNSGGRERENASPRAAVSCQEMLDGFAKRLIR